MGAWDNDEMCWMDFSEIVRETPSAYLLTIENEDIWLPKSQIVVDKTSGIVGIPAWLAKKDLTD